MKSLLYARRNPYPLMLWLAISGSGILFLFISFVFLTRFGLRDDVPIPFPLAFYVSTPLLLLSSLTLVGAHRNFKTEQYPTHRRLLLATLVLGLCFTISQFVGWGQMFANGYVLGSGTMGGSFVYLVTGLHGLHVFGGLLALGFLVWNAFNNPTYVANFLNGMNPFHLARVQLLTIYWHFIDVLWVFLMLMIFFMR